MQQSVEQSLTTDEIQPIHFLTAFAGSMTMLAEQAIVADYLQHHQGWFCRCAQPMQAEPLGEHGYILTIGRFGALGFDVEPKMGVILEPPCEGHYFMHTVPIPDEPFLGYEVDYQADMILVEMPTQEMGEDLSKVYRRQGDDSIPERITQVQWHLEMDVAVTFPSYIYKLPRGLIQRTGDRLLAEIIRQVSPRLTYKVQKDFHELMSLPLPPKSGRHFYRIKRQGDTSLNAQEAETEDRQEEEETLED